jgi:hypothetical protein
LFQPLSRYCWSSLKCWNLSWPWNICGRARRKLVFCGF